MAGHRSALDLRCTEERGVTVAELSAVIGITPANLSMLKNGRAKAVRFAPLSALCEGWIGGRYLRGSDFSDTGALPDAANCA